MDGHKSECCVPWPFGQEQHSVQCVLVCRSVQRIKSCHHPPTLLGKDSTPSCCPFSVCHRIMTSVKDLTVWNLGVFALGVNSIQVRPIRGPSHLPNLPPARRPRPIVHRTLYWWGLGDAMLHLKQTTHTMWLARFPFCVCFPVFRHNCFLTQLLRIVSR